MSLLSLTACESRTDELLETTPLKKLTNLSKQQTLSHFLRCDDIWCGRNWKSIERILSHKRSMHAARFERAHHKVCMCTREQICLPVIFTYVMLIHSSWQAGKYELYHINWAIGKNTFRTYSTWTLQCHKALCFGLWATVLCVLRLWFRFYLFIFFYHDPYVLSLPVSCTSI